MPYIYSIYPMDAESWVGNLAFSEGKLTVRSNIFRAGLGGVQGFQLYPGLQRLQIFQN